MTENHIGKSLWVATAAPATNDAAGFEALIWVEVSGLLTAPQFGVTHSDIDVPDLKTGFTIGLKGAAQGVSTTATFRKVDSDTGQGDLKTAANDQSGVISLRLVTGTGTGNAPATGDVVQYAQGYAKDYQENQAETGGYEGFQIGFRQNDFTVDGTIPA